MPPRNDWERVVDLLAGFVAGSLEEEDHLAHCERVVEAEKLLKKVAPDRLKAVRAALKEFLGND